MDRVWQWGSKGLTTAQSPVGAGNTPSSAEPSGPLSHIKVLDLSRVLAGPWASQLLGDLGADVIKIERPAVGDETRHWGPPWLADGNGEPTSDAAYFFCCNRNKRSLTVDITKPEGQAIVRQLAVDADVVLENFKVGGLAPTASTTPACTRSTRSWSIARSPVSARMARMRNVPATIF